MYYNECEIELYQRGGDFMNKLHNITFTLWLRDDKFLVGFIPFQNILCFITCNRSCPANQALLILYNLCRYIFIFSVKGNFS